MNPPTPIDPEEVLKQAPWLRRLARQLVGDVHGAEDLIQDTRVMLLQRPRESSNPVGWFAGTLRNLALHAKREKGRRSIREQGSALPDLLPSTLEIVERADLHNALVHAVAELREPYRAILLLRFFEELPPRTISKRLNLPVSTVQTQLSRGLELLRERLDQGAGGRDSWMPGLAILGWGLPTPGGAYPLLGAVLMKLNVKLVGLAMAMFLGCLIWIIGGAGWSQEGGDPHEFSASTLATMETKTNTPPEPSEELDGLADRESRRSVSTKVVTPKIEQGPCVVIGTVLDTSGAPVVGAQVQLGAYQGWADGAEAIRLEASYDLRGFAIETDQVGRFRFAVPVPTAVGVRLTVNPEGFLDSYTVNFNPASRGGQPILQAGVRDLGEILLATTGSVSGMVLDEQGRPVEGVKMGLGPTSSQTYGRDVFTRKDGSYVIDHAPVGTYGIRANSKAHLYQYRRPITVEAGQGTRGIDFVLVAAPTIEGRIVNMVGSPVEGARVVGKRADPTAGRSCRTTTGQDGRFILNLMSKGPHTISVNAQGFEPWGGVGQVSAPFDPDTRDLQIVLKGIALTRFLVLDDVTGQPIEHFGMKVHLGYGSKAKSGRFIERRAPHDSEYPGGVATATCREDLDIFVIGAKGYHQVSGDVQYDKPGVAFQTVRLRAKKPRKPKKKGNSVIAGRVLVPPGIDPGGLKVYLGDWRKGVTATTMSDGSFQFRELRRGSHRLTLEGRPGLLASLKSEKVKLKKDETLDVVLDARQQAMCNVSLTLHVPGVDISGAQVALVSDHGDGERSSLGSCDANGNVMGAARAFGSARIELLQFGGVRRLHPKSLDLIPGGNLQETRSFESATLSIEWPQSVDLPDQGVAKIMINSLDIDGGDRTLDLRFKEGQINARYNSRVNVRGRRITLLGLAPGRYRIDLELANSRSVTLEEAAELGGPMFMGDGDITVDEPAYHSHSAEVELNDREEFDLRLR